MTVRGAAARPVGRERSIRPAISSIRPGGTRNHLRQALARAALEREIRELAQRPDVPEGALPSCESLLDVRLDLSAVSKRSSAAACFIRCVCARYVVVGIAED